jgi:GIY-YIG catalytic domain
MLNWHNFQEKVLININSTEYFILSITMITIHRIFEIYGIEPSEVRLVRHGNKEISILETFKENLPQFEAYQSFQKPGKFGEASAIAVFAPYYSTTALFLGLWDIKGCTKASEYTKKTQLELKKHKLPDSWFYDGMRYSLKKNNILDDMSERLVIEWGAATVAWVQSKDKEVVELKGKKSIGDFYSFDQVNLDFRNLEMLIQSPDTNFTWVKALSSVNGVYLIKDKLSGKLYVGSAYGEQGIYGRWSTYAQNGHGGNKKLKPLDPKKFEFSILEIVPPTSSANEVIQRENRWKEKLGTRESGLNDN